MWQLQDLLSLTPREFEGLIEILYRALGYDTLLTRLVGDGGVDIIATKGETTKKHYIQVKRFMPSNKIGYKIVRQCAALKLKRSVDQVSIVTSSDFTKRAKKEAELLGISLTNGRELINLLNLFQVIKFS